MRAVPTDPVLDLPAGFPRTGTRRSRLHRTSCRAVAAACLIAAMAIGCATAPEYSPPPLVGIVTIPPPHRNYVERLASLDSDKDGGVLYWATYGH